MTAQGARARPASEVSRAAALVDRFVQLDQFSGVILVARDGRPIFRAARGMANRAWGIRNTSQTRFGIGSITKQFTAAAILQLQQRGVLSIDDPVSTYYDAPPGWRRVTLRELLDHSSGIPDYEDSATFNEPGEERIDRTPDQLIGLVKDQPLAFEPGAKFAYSNTDYIVLGAIIERLTHQAYGTYLQDHIFGPLQMTASGYDDGGAVVPEHASGYERAPNGVVDAAYVSPTARYAAGGLYSTAGDLLRWDQGLDGDRVLDSTSRAEMFRDEGHGYGLGWYVDRAFDRPHAWHNGIMNGFLSRIDRYPADHLTVIVLANDMNARVWPITVDLGAIFLGVPARTASRTSRARLTELIEGYERGQLDDGAMAPDVASDLKAGFAVMRSAIAGLGALRQVRPIAADPNGDDYYVARFERGALTWKITIDAQGRIAGVNAMRDVPPSRRKRWRAARQSRPGRRACR